MISSELIKALSGINQDVLLVGGAVLLITLAIISFKLIKRAFDPNYVSGRDRQKFYKEQREQKQQDRINKVNQQIITQRQQKKNKPLVNDSLPLVSKDTQSIKGQKRNFKKSPSQYSDYQKLKHAQRVLSSMSINQSAQSLPISKPILNSKFKNRSVFKRSVKTSSAIAEKNYSEYVNYKHTKKFRDSHGTWNPVVPNIQPEPNSKLLILPSKHNYPNLSEFDFDRLVLAKAYGFNNIQELEASDK